QLDAAAAAAAPLIDRLGRGGAVVCASDALAVGAWKALLERGMAPGIDFGLVGFDDTDLAPALGLTTLRQPLADVADTVLQMLGSGPPPPPAAAHGVLLPPQLAVRASSTPAGDRIDPKEK